MRVLSIRLRLLGPGSMPLAMEGFNVLSLVWIDGSDLPCSGIPFKGAATGARFFGATIFASRARSASDKSSFLFAN